MKVLKFLGAILLCLSFSVVWAHSAKKTKKKPSPWKGTNVQFGFNKNTGNTQTTNITSQVNVTYDKGSWLNTGQFQYQWGKSKGEVNKEKYFLTNQTDYAFNRPRTTFVFLAETYTMDKFSPYDYQALLAAGLGHDLIRNDKIIWSAQAGPGYRRSRETVTRTVNTSPVLTTQTNLTWNINQGTQFTQLLQGNFSKPYDYYKSTSAITSTLFDQLAVQVSFSAEHYTSIPKFSKNTEKTDTTTLVSLIYNF